MSTADHVLEKRFLSPIALIMRGGAHRGAALFFCLLLLLLAACREPDPTLSPALTVTPRAQGTAQVAAATPWPATATSGPTATAAAFDNDTYLPLAANGSTRIPPPSATTQARATATSTPSPTSGPPPFPTYEGPPLRSAQIGIQLHLHREELNPMLNHVTSLGAGWVKVQVSWKVYEPAPGEYDAWLFRELDHLVSGAAGRDLNVLLSVAKAPEWSRPTNQMDGPPGDFAEFQRFMQYLAGRYEGNVAAYELWNEPNLRREWNGAPLDAASFGELVRIGAAGVRAGDSQALVISGAPATTGINDGQTAIDDRVYLQGMLAAGVGEVVDGVGVHPYGWANPADASAADAEQVAPTHNNHPSFFFADTLDQYRSLLEQAGHGALPLWVTEFGWGSFEGLGASPPPEAAFMAHVSEWQQAEYTLKALEMGQERPGVGPMFLWNLNFAPTLGADFSESGYSVLRPDGVRRPVYLALENAPKQ